MSICCLFDIVSEEKAFSHYGVNLFSRCKVPTGCSLFKSLLSWHGETQPKKDAITFFQVSDDAIRAVADRLNERMDTDPAAISIQAIARTKES